MSLVDEVLTKHERRLWEGASGGGWCSLDKQNWPCESVRLALSLRAAEKALEYYAEPRNYGDGYLGRNDAYDDLKLPGTRARAALAEYDKGGQG